MPGINKLYLNNLHSIAERQNGYFTAKQALEAGYSRRMQIYHVQNEDWERYQRGIFRFKLYPPDEHPDLMPWYLWSCNSAGEPQAVFSHDTALSIYGIGTWRSKKIHITVPPGFRRSSIPKILSLHFDILKDKQITTEHFVPVTNPVKTFADLIKDNLSQDFLKEALADAVEKQLITPQDIHASQIDIHHKQLLNHLLKQVHGQRKKISNSLRIPQSA
jgi:predicted transcriptional regulator of viral defense system